MSGYVFLNPMERIRNNYLVAKGGSDKRNWGPHQYYSLGTRGESPKTNILKPSEKQEKPDDSVKKLEFIRQVAQLKAKNQL